MQLSRSELEGLLDQQTVATLWKLPAAAGLTDGRTGEWVGTVDVFIRRYTAETRPFIAFHCDGAAATVNVALSSSADEDTSDDAAGGVLLCLHSGKVAPERRREGEATVHPSGLLHGVTSLRRHSPARYSMIMFFERPLRGAAQAK